MTTEFFLDGSTHPRRLVVSGELDLLNAPELLERLNWLAGSGRPTHLDLTDVPFIDAATITALSRAARGAKARGTVIRVVAASDPVQRVMELCDASWLLDAAER